MSWELEQIGYINRRKPKNTRSKGRRQTATGKKNGVQLCAQVMIINHIDAQPQFCRKHIQKNIQQKAILIWWCKSLYIVFMVSERTSKIFFHWFLSLVYLMLHFISISFLSFLISSTFIIFTINTGFTFWKSTWLNWRCVFVYYYLRVEIVEEHCQSLGHKQN